MMRDEYVRLAEIVDRVEADLVRLQSRLWSVRQALQEAAGRTVGHQYGDEPLERTDALVAVAQSIVQRAGPRSILTLSQADLALLREALGGTP